MSELFHHRLESLERRSDKLEDTLSELNRHTGKISNLLEKYVEIEGRVRRCEERCYELEKTVSNNRVVLSAVKWLAITIGGSATTIIVASVLAPMVVK